MRVNSVIKAPTLCSESRYVQVAYRLRKQTATIDILILFYDSSNVCLFVSWDLYRDPEVGICLTFGIMGFGI